MTSFGTIDEFIDFTNKFGVESASGLTGGVNPLDGTGFKHLYKKGDGKWMLQAIGWGGGGGSDSSNVGKPPYEDPDGGLPPNISDNNYDEKYKIMMEDIARAKESNKSNYPGDDAFFEIVGKGEEAGFNKLLVQALAFAGLSGGKYISAFLNLIDSTATSKAADGGPLLTTQVSLSNKAGKIIGKLVITKDAKGLLRYIVYGTTNSKKGSYFWSSTDGSKFPKAIEELEKHSEEDSDETPEKAENEGKEGPLKNDQENKEDADKETLENGDQQVDPPADNGSEDDRDSPVVAPLT